MTPCDKCHGTLKVRHPNCSCNCYIACSCEPAQTKVKLELEQGFKDFRSLMIKYDQQLTKDLK